jgi:hypothetical protein
MEGKSAIITGVYSVSVDLLEQIVQSMMISSFLWHFAHDKSESVKTTTSAKPATALSGRIN